LYQENNIVIKKKHEHFGYKLIVDDVLKKKNLNLVENKLGIDVLIAIFIDGWTLPQGLSTECQLVLTLVFYDTQSGDRLVSATGFSKHFSESFYRENALTEIYFRLVNDIFEGYHRPIHVE
jgi:hypothetical protein